MHHVRYWLRQWQEGSTSTKAPDNGKKLLVLLCSGATCQLLPAAGCEHAVFPSLCMYLASRVVLATASLLPQGYNGCKQIKVHQGLEGRPKAKNTGITPLLD